MSKDKTKKTTVSAVRSVANTKVVSNIQSFGKYLKSIPLVGIVVAEFIGTFILTVAFLQMQGSPLFYGLAVVGAVLIVGGVSGAHLNPAITLGAFATRKINAVTAVFYIAAQILGAIAAWWMLNQFAKMVVVGSADVRPVFHSGAVFSGTDTGAIQKWSDKAWVLFYLELLGATILTLGAAMAVRLRKNKIVASFTAGLAAMIALYAGLSLASSLSGLVTTSDQVGLVFLNPAIAIAANAITWPLTSWSVVIYIAAPVIGGVLAFMLSDYLHSQSNSCDCTECEA